MLSVIEKNVKIMTYEIGEAQKCPMFLEKRVYQGSSGRVYPYPTIDKVTDIKREREYKALILENDYIEVMILPELGGRIQRAYDKTNKYDFVYYNEVIKPALVGLLGPWISGGIEFNWPQHHRPTTFMPTDYRIIDNNDNSKSVLIGDFDSMYGTKSLTKFTLYEDKAYIEITGQLYNGTPYPQTFLWWANPAVSVNDYTQSVFPPDVHAVMDHGKRDVSEFPIARGTYYKHDYSAGVDISRYKNIPVPTSYMAEKSDYDFVGGYDYKKQAGILHIADHHISPGKKQWTWGCGDFGKAWDRNLTDNNGPYIELMTGMYTDNQPDFTWLKPYEEKVFTQYFMPYKGVELVKNATKEAMVNLYLEDNKISYILYTSSRYNVEVEIREYRDNDVNNKHNMLADEVKSNNVKNNLQDDKTKYEYMQYNGAKTNYDIIYNKTIDISPLASIKDDIELKKYVDESNISKYEIVVTDVNTGKVLVSYRAKLEKDIEIPEPAKEPLPPSDIESVEELYLTGLHIEQYRHATYSPLPYYMEGLRRDPKNSQINNALGIIMMKKCRYKDAEKYFDNAIERVTLRNPNPYNSECYYNMGICKFYESEYEQAYDYFYKACWSNEQQEMAYYYLALINCRDNDYCQAYYHIERALVKNSENIKARGLKAYILRKLNKIDEAIEYVKDNLRLDAFDYYSQNELSKLAKLSKSSELNESGRLDDFNMIGKYGDAVCGSNNVTNSDAITLEGRTSKVYIRTAIDYANCGDYEEAVNLLNSCKNVTPMVFYYKYYYLKKIGREYNNVIVYAENMNSDYCFPNTNEDYNVLISATSEQLNTPKAHYYLGCLLYDKKEYEKAAGEWIQSIAEDDSFYIVHRNMALYCYNKQHDCDKALEYLSRAWELSDGDARIFMELDSLKKKLMYKPSDRLKDYENNMDIVMERDDLKVEYVTLLNLVSQYEKAYDIIMNNTFHPWEGGEGRISMQYKVALIQMAKEDISNSRYNEAIEKLEKALVYPNNLGEGKLEGCKDNDIYYYLAIAHSKLNDGREDEYLDKANHGSYEVASAMYYNDQPAHMIMYEAMALRMQNRESEAAYKRNLLYKYATEHMEDDVRIEYFAVSLPDMQIFDDDLNRRNKAHCHYLLGMAALIDGDKDRASEELKETLLLDNSHIQATLMLKEL